MSVRLAGRPVSPGIGVAPAFVVDRSRPLLPDRAAASARSADEEQHRLTEALATVAAGLRKTAVELAATVGDAEAAIFEAHAEFADDPEIAAEAARRIAAGATAELAVTEAFDGFRRLLAASSSDYLAARAADLDDVRDQVLGALGGDRADSGPTEPCVIVAQDLTPSDTVRLPRHLIAGIVCQGGSEVSHAAILARALQIPAVVGVAGVLDAVAPGVVVALDGRAGDVVVGMDEGDEARFHRRARTEARRREELAALAGAPAQTADGHRIVLAANINDPADVDRARVVGADGAGLVRTELLFLERPTAPDVDTQARYYRELLEAFPRQRVVIRTLDIGADKRLRFVGRAPDPNPALGVRGVRLGLAMPELLEAQVRALVRSADAGRLCVLFPMVSTAGELGFLVDLVRRVADEEGVDRSSFEVGTMIEVPAAALACRRLARQVDFVSVGTNDLLQYLFAADRLVSEVAQLPDILEPGVLSLLASVVDGAHAEGAWVGVCGELASEPVVAAALVGLGADELSMAASAIGEVKDHLRRAARAELAAAAAAATRAADAPAARLAIEQVLRA
jgi:phosphoenolpyruvate-protein phosphotransferase